MEPRLNKPLYNEVLGITNDIFQPSNSVMYGKEPRYREPTSPVPWHFVKSRFDCIGQKKSDTSALSNHRAQWNKAKANAKFFRLSIENPSKSTFKVNFAMGPVFQCRVKLIKPVLALVLSSVLYLDDVDSCKFVVF